MKAFSYTLAILAALAAVTPGICMCGCPCAMLFGGEAKPAKAASQPVHCCCHAPAPDAGASIGALHRCCCAPREAPGVLTSAPAIAPSSDGTISPVAQAMTASWTILLPMATTTGTDPPDVVASHIPSTLHAVLRN